MTITKRQTAYLDRRGICPEVAAKLGLFSAIYDAGEKGAEFRETDDESTPWLAVPYVYEGKVFRIQGRNLKPGIAKKDRHRWSSIINDPSIESYDFEDDDGPSLIPFNADAIAACAAEKGTLIISEGDMDPLSAMTAGYPYAIGIPGASNAACLKPFLHHLRRIPRIVIASDADAAGDKLFGEICDLLGDVSNVMRVLYPDGADGEDLNHVLMTHGVDSVREVIDGAQFIPLDGEKGVYDLEDSPPLNPKFINSFGADMRRMIAFCDTHLSIVTGVPSSGKSRWVKSVVWALSREHGVKSSVAFFEDRAKRDTMRHLTAVHSDTDGYNFDREKEAEAWKWADQSIRFIDPDVVETDITIKWWLERAKRQANAYGCKFFVVDPWNYFVPDQQGESKTQEMARVSASLKAFRGFAIQYGVHVCLIAHPRKPDTFGRVTKMPEGHDIAGSGDFQRMCDLGITIGRDPQLKGVTNVKVWKVRDEPELGEFGNFSLLFNRSGRFGGVTAAELAEMRGDEDNVTEFSSYKRA